MTLGKMDQKGFSWISGGTVHGGPQVCSIKNMDIQYRYRDIVKLIITII